MNDSYQSCSKCKRKDLSIYDMDYIHDSLVLCHDCYKDIAAQEECYKCGALHLVHEMYLMDDNVLYCIDCYHRFIEFGE